MILRNRHNLYEADATQGTPQPTPPPPANGQGQTPQQGEAEKKKAEPITLTSGQLKKRLEDAKAVERKAFLESLGIDSEESLKTLVSSAKAQAESEKTEAQKLSERLANLEKQLQEKEAKLSESERRSRLEKRDAKLEGLLSKAVDPAKALILLKADYGSKLDDLMNEDGEFDSAAASALIAEYQKANNYLFRDERQGSAMSNRDGRVPEPDKDRRKAVERKLSKTIQGF